MDLARQELGDEALLVNARPATPETRYLGAYEVVFGIPPRPAEASAPPSKDRPLQDVTGLKRELERHFEEMMRSFLERHDLAHPTRVEEVVEAFPLCGVDPTLGRPGAERAIVAMIGPPGAGKTTTLIKLAAQYGLTSRRPVYILSADVHRIAAADQLRSLAAILGIDCDIADTTGSLAQRIEEHRSKELIFVDTPGLSRAEMEDGADLAEWIASHPEIDTHLVLPAFMRASDMARAIEQYAIFRPNKLLFTNIDETDSHQDLVREAAKHSLAVSFLGTGQQIPDDLEPASLSKLEELLGRATQIAHQNVPGHTKGAAA